MTLPLDQWNQFGANPAGSRFRTVNSTPAASPTWRLALPGPIGTTSPVIGPDGTIYIGNLHGQLFAVSPDGSLKWTTAVGTSDYTVRTPVVTADGKIFCLVTFEGVVREHRDSNSAPPTTNFLVGVLDNGTLFRHEPIGVQGGGHGYVNGVIDGAPRIVTSGSESRIVFVVRYTYTVAYPELGPGATGPMVASYIGIAKIFDQAGGTLLRPYDQAKEFVDAHGGGGLGGSAHLGPLTDLPGPKLPAGARPCADMPVVFGSIGDQFLTIVAPCDSGLHRIDYNQEFLNLIPSGQIFLRGTFPGPSAFPNGLISHIAGLNAYLIDAESFTQFNPNPTGLLRNATVAGHFRQMVFLQRQGTLTLVDTNGTVVQSKELGADSVAYPALTMNHVHVATAQGLRTLTLMLEDVASVDLPGAGFSSPAVDAKGSVFVATDDALFGFVNGPATRYHDLISDRPMIHP